MYHLPLTIKDCANADMTPMFWPGAAVVLTSYNILAISGCGSALAIVTDSEFKYLPTIGSAYTYAGSQTPELCAINGNYLAWADANTISLSVLPTADWSAAATSITDVANHLTFEAGTDNLLISHTEGLMVLDCTNPGGSVAPTTGMISHYSMDNITGSTLTDDAGTQDGTITGATQVAGHIGQALQFAGGGDHVSVAQNSAHEFGSATDFSYALWFKTSQSTRGDILENGYNGNTGKWSGLYVYNGIFAGCIDDGTSAVFASGATNAWTINDDEWHLGVVNFDRDGNLQRYIDAEAYGDPYDISSVGDITNTEYGMLIGMRTGTTDYFVGQMDEIRIYSGLLTVEEIQDMYLEGVGGGIEYAASLGTVTNCQAAWKEGEYIAYGTSNGADGGRFGLLLLDNDLVAASKTTIADTDTDAVWLSAGATDAIHNNTLERYRLVAEVSPGVNAINVRRDWALYAEITDSLGGIQAGTVVLTINGQTVSPTVSAITDGYAAAYTPGSSSGYAQRITVKLSGTDADGNTVSKIWSFVTAAAPTATVTDTTPPNVVCTRDIRLGEGEADEVVDGVNVVWQADISSPLIVEQVQAERVGKVEIDGTTYNEWRLSATILPTDAAGFPTRDIQQGETVAMTVPSLGMAAQPCEVLAKQRIVRGGLTRYRMSLGHYEQV
ncbi:MAG: LamG domain-containing protein [Pedobacter sp.]